MSGLSHLALRLRHEEPGLAHRGMADGVDRLSQTLRWQPQERRAMGPQLSSAPTRPLCRTYRASSVQLGVDIIPQSGHPITVCGRAAHVAIYQLTTGSKVGF